MRNQRGITLIEMMITMTILAALVAFSTQSFQQALKSKLKIQDQVDSMSQVRDALRIIEKDLNLAFHYRDLELEFHSEVKKSYNAAVPPQPPPPPGSPPNPNQPYVYNFIPSANRVDPETHFIGSSEEMNFATLNAGRIYEDTLQADFVKVGYSLSSCRKASSEGASQKCLLRRMSTLVEGDIKKGGESTVLLEGVTEFKIRYIAKGKQDWINDWDSKQGDGAAKGNFPESVEISVTTEKENRGAKKKISMQIVVPIRFANNNRTN